MGVCCWVRESPTLYQSKFCLFCDPILEYKRSIVLDFNLLLLQFLSALAIPLNGTLFQTNFFMITRPYPRVNGLKTTSFPAAHTRIANIWEYPLPREVYNHIACSWYVDVTETLLKINSVQFSALHLNAT